MSEIFQNLTAIITLPFFICHQNTRLKIEFTWHKIILTWFKINFTWHKNKKKITGSAHNLFTVFFICWQSAFSSYLPSALSVFYGRII